MPTLHVVAGPNGCGKSTLTRMNGFGGLVPIDPDSILRGMVSGTPAQAARKKSDDRGQRDVHWFGQKVFVSILPTGIIAILENHCEECDP